MAKAKAAAKASKKGKKRVDDDEEDSKPAKKVGKKVVGDRVFDPYAQFQSTMDDIARRHDVASDLMEDIPPLSTGCLAMDLIYGGGLRPGWFTHAGQEQTCKTTGAYVAMASAVKSGVPVIAFWDYEGSGRSGKRYIANIVKTSAGLNKKHIFGKKDDEGRWEVRPTVQFFSESRGEKFFDWCADLLRKLPDKKQVKGKWWLIYEDNKENKAKYGEFANPSMPKKYGKGIWIEAPDDNLQGLIIVDSYPGMNPPSNDDEEADNSLGVQARFFSKHIPRVKGRMAQKMVAVLGINQLSDIPMAMYGPKEQEKGGKSLRYFSDSRIWWASRTSGMPFSPKFDKEEYLELEKSVEFEDSKDRYRYVQANAKKNKLATPGRKVWVRVWVGDGEGEARGFDPLFDVVQYLRLTGQLTYKRRDKMLLNFDKFGEATAPVDWMTMKRWVLGDKETKIRICKKLGFKPFDLRKYCFSQLSSGIGETLFNNMRKGNGKDDEEEE